MIDTSININGEEYMKYNVKRWGSDGWFNTNYLIIIFKIKNKIN